MSINPYSPKPIKTVNVKPSRNNSLASVFIVVGCFTAAIILGETRYNSTLETVEVDMMPAEQPLLKQADTIAVAVAEAKTVGEAEFAVISPPKPEVSKLRTPIERKTAPKKTTVEQLYSGKPSNRFKDGYATGETSNFTPGDAESYLKYIAAFAKAAHKRTRIPTSVIMAQNMVESANGNSFLARKHNNHFGLKCRTNCRKRGHCVQRKDDTKHDRFRSFTNLSQAFEAYATLLESPRYNRARCADPYTSIIGLKKAGYATDPNYVEVLWSKIQKHNLTKYD